MKNIMLGIIGVVAGVLVGVFLLPDNSKPIKVEAPPVLSVHPLCNELSTGYLLVEIWTTDGTFEYPHVVRMRRTEYLEWMRQNPR